MNLMDVLTTTTKIFSVFGCAGAFMHITSGLHILRAGKGYVCPECGEEVKDITKTKVGRAWMDTVRPEFTPLPHRKAKLD
jgi:predicted RNA-binding Zn-ribbon protein involved in translation (DUF1610 family)